MGTSTTVTDGEVTDSEEMASRRSSSWVGALAGELALDVGLSLAAFWLAIAAGWGTVGATLAAGTVAVARAVWTAVIRGTVDTSLLLVVLGFLTSLILALVSGDARVLLLKGSAGLALFGVVAAASLVWGRPLLFWLVRRFVAPGSEGRHQWEELWHGSTPFRWLYRRLTVVWALVYLLAAAGHVTAVLTLPVEVAAPWLRAATPLLSVAMIAWTAWFSARAERRLEGPLLDEAEDASVEAARVETESASS
ncbi:VC0807 family protein [Ornithinimicrobium faecis]|uniref:VC0807 family protein n=1 Tax=Ornithinimicrobium faecis TaxID=2934158 RepID=UPI002117B686|nr:VC0807 family protein [Ornithinimicrobium sp. HY1745]